MNAQQKGLLDPDVIRCPYPHYETLRNERPIAFLPELGAYFASNYELVKQVLTDLRFQKPPEKNGRKFVPPNKAYMDVLLRDEEIGLPVHVLSRTSGAQQAGFRKIVEPYVGRRGAKKLEPFIQTCADFLLDRIEKKEVCEVVEDFSSPFTILVMCDVIGFPRSMLEEVKAYAEAALSYLAFVQTDEEATANAEKVFAMHNIVREMIRERRSNPKDDVLTALGTATVEGQPLTERQMVYLIEELTTGGHDTTSNGINGGLQYLAQNPEMQERLRANPEKVEKFVEEALRVLTPIQVAHRVAMEDIEVGGVLVPKGQNVFLLTSSANRDGNRFECPANFDLDRPDASQHMAFGGGQHFCLGNFLARAEQRIAYSSWLKRFSSFELAVPAESIVFRNTHVTRAPIELPIRLHRA